jgi:hypothetical protein
VPYLSVSQQRWAHTPQGTAALGGADKVREWDQATAHQAGGFKALPQRAPAARAAVPRHRPSHKALLDMAQG